LQVPDYEHHAAFLDPVPPPVAQERVPPLPTSRWAGGAHVDPRSAGGAHVDRRVAGAHRAAGLAGPPNRYALIVILLASLTSLPTLAAIRAGAASLADDGADGTTPFIAQPPDELAVIVPMPVVPFGVDHSASAQAGQRAAPAPGRWPPGATTAARPGQRAAVARTALPAAAPGGDVRRARCPAPPARVGTPKPHKPPRHEPRPRGTASWPVAVAGHRHHQRPPHRDRGWRGQLARAHIVGARG
jgi:hypothetical protein